VPENRTASRGRRGKTDMGVIVLILGCVGVFVAAFAAWYALWHRRVDGSFEKVQVGTNRPVYVLRAGATLGGPEGGRE